MSRGGIIIQNRGDGRGMMVPEREGRGTFNKLPFVSMANPKEELGINPIPTNLIIKTRKINQKPFKKDKKSEIEDKLYPLEKYRKIKTTQQFWKKNENPIYKDYNNKIEKSNGNKAMPAISNDIINESNNDIKNKTLTNTLKTPQKLKPIINKTSLKKKKLIDERKSDENVYEVKPEVKEVKVTNEINYKNKNEIPEKNNDINNDKNNDININNNTNSDLKENIKDNVNKEKNKEENNKDIDIKDKKDPLLEDDLDTENIDEVINYLNGLDYDKYCKDMEIREALTLLKNKMDKELEEKKIEEEKNKNKVIIEGEEQKENNNEEEEKNNEENKNNSENKDKDKDNNKCILPEIIKKIPEQNPIEIVNEEELKRKEEIKKYKIAEQIAKTEQMKAVHSVNSIKKLLQREGLDKIEEPAPLKITVIKENPLAKCDGYEANKLPFLHSLPLV